MEIIIVFAILASLIIAVAIIITKAESKRYWINKQIKDFIEMNGFKAMDKEKTIYTDMKHTIVVDQFRITIYRPGLNKEILKSISFFELVGHTLYNNIINKDFKH